MEIIKTESQKKRLHEIKESIEDELMKLPDLEEKGVLSNEEFVKMKQDLKKKETSVLNLCTFV